MCIVCKCDKHTILFFFQAEKKDMTVSEAGLVFSFFALIMFLLSPAMGSIVSTNFFIHKYT